MKTELLPKISCLGLLCKLNIEHVSMNEVIQTRGDQHRMLLVSEIQLIQQQSCWQIDCRNPHVYKGKTNKHLQGKNNRTARIRPIRKKNTNQQQQTHTQKYLTMGLRNKIPLSFDTVLLLLLIFPRTSLNGCGRNMPCSYSYGSRSRSKGVRKSNQRITESQRLQVTPGQTSSLTLQLKQVPYSRMHGKASSEF